ncbi:DUF317 domain-containing protein [Streptomyces nojiriensis]|uniref:DUF317 domain-containing protein n=1 Tax=Streptomyces nojiriensis TaxID=66374 RepID=UPI0035D67F8B
MSHASADAHIRFTLHPDHHPSVIATTSGPTSDAARSHLHDLGFRSTGPDTMVLARIDHEEPYYANATAKQLIRYGFTVEIAPSLQEEIDTEWSWGNYPYPWCTRDEVREVSAEAQRIHDDIAEGRLIIHLHADDGHTTVAVGTYASGLRRTVHLHGENHLRQITQEYDDEAEALGEFHKLYTVAVRPGPAPITERERSARNALTAGVRKKNVPARDLAGAATSAVKAAVPPTADPGEHEALLASFLDFGPQWEKYRTWSDETTIASHESLASRVEFDHEARHRTDTAWTFAEYDGPVGERLWSATVTVGTPVALIHAMLSHLDAPVFAGATEPHSALQDAGWHPASHPARTTWQAPNRSMTFEHALRSDDERWALYGGDDLNEIAWSIRLSPGVPHDLLARLTEAASDLYEATRQPAGRQRQPAPVPRLPAVVPRPAPRVR